MKNIYKLVGLNPNYATVVEMYDPENSKEIPEWLTDILKPDKVEDDIIKFKIVLSEKVSEYYLDTGGIIVVPNGSIMIKSNDRGIEVISRSAFEELYILDKKIPWYKSLLKSLKHLL